jgi:hypothetical protein
VRLTVYVQELGLVDSAGNNVETANATLAGGGTERGIVTRAAGVRASRVTSRR